MKTAYTVALLVVAASVLVSFGWPLACVLYDALSALVRNRRDAANLKDRS